MPAYTLRERATEILAYSLDPSDPQDTFEQHLKELASPQSQVSPDDAGNFAVWEKRGGYEKLLKTLVRLRGGESASIADQEVIRDAPRLLSLWAKKYDADIAQYRSNIRARASGNPASLLEGTVQGLHREMAAAAHTPPSPPGKEANPSEIFQEVNRFVRHHSPRHQQKQARKGQRALQEELENRNAEDSAEIVSCGSKKKRLLGDVALRFEGLAADLGITPERGGPGAGRR